MILYLVVAMLGVLILIVSAVLGEVVDIFDGLDGGDGGTGKVAAAAMTAFGAAGMLATYYDLGTFASGVIAVLAALLMGALAWWIITTLYRGTASTDVSIDSLLGRRGQVTVGIPAGSVGEVLVTAADSTRHLIARAGDGGAIPEGTPVRITQTLGSVVIVERADQPSPAQPATS